MVPKVLVSLAIAFTFTAVAQDHTSRGSQAKSATLVTGLGDLHHPVSTQNPEAQRFFDQGLRYIYAFNHDEAERSFQHAGELDPRLAMAWWGVAEAVGPNYNDVADDPRFAKAHEAVQKAVDLSANASVSEKAYIDAMARRFPADAKADRHKAAEDYANAMREVMRGFPDDPDAATLFAEAAMNLRPWELWHLDGTPADGTLEIVSTLESVIRHNPDHLGAIHYYIHAVEASPNPERALAWAAKLPTIAPGAGHIVHMPAHIYIRTGDYGAAVKINEEAATVDRAYIKANGAEGIYPMMYYSHNLHFIAICAAMDGDYVEAKKNADMLAAHVGPYVKEMPPIEAFMAIPLAVDVRFHQWGAILNTPQPEPSMQATTGFWHFARGLALVGTGKVKDAQEEYKFLADAAYATPETAVMMPVNNRIKDIFIISRDIVGARVAIFRKEFPSAIAQLREAVATQDTLKYNEPPDWFYPVRESLGAVLLMSGDSSGAEKIFRDDLEHNPRNPRSLFGLEQALKAQGRNYDAGFVHREFQEAWKGGATPLKLEDLV